jgi:Amidase
VIPFEVLRLSATQQARSIREGKISSAELVEAYLEQIARVDPAIHATVAVFREKAMELARRADQDLARGRKGLYTEFPLVSRIRSKSKARFARQGLGTARGCGSPCGLGSDAAEVCATRRHFAELLASNRLPAACRGLAIFRLQAAGLKCSGRSVR